MMSETNYHKTMNVYLCNTFEKVKADGSEIYNEYNLWWTPNNSTF
jgi:hypothetical protein